MVAWRQIGLRLDEAVAELKLQIFVCLILSSNMAK